MRSSAVEGPHAPRARQTPPTGSSGGTVGLASSPHSHSSPRPQLTAGALPIKSSLQGVSRGSNLSPSPQNRPPSQARTVSGQAQVQRSQQRTADQQQRSPPNNITPSSNSISSNSKSLPPGHKGGQPRPAQQSQSNKSSFPQQTVSSKSSTPGPKPQAGASLKQVPSAKSAQSANPPNFGEYDDQEWDVGVGHLIIDLDADIAQADRGKMSSVSPASSTNNGNLGIADDKHSLKMKIKRTKPPTKTSEAKHEIVKTESAPNSTNNATPNSPVVHSTPQHNGAAVKEENGSAPRGPTSTARVVYKKEKRRLDVNGVTSPPAQSVASSRALLQVSSTTTTTTTSSAPLLSQSQPTTNTGVVTPSTQAIQSSLPSSSSTSTLTSTSIKMEQQVVSSTGSNVLTSATKTTSNNVLQGSAVNQNNDISHSDASASPAPASKRPKLSDENVKRDVCVGTSVGTLTEPECLGPCEPGSSVTLEGIVWHETEGGVLVVNVTWRGKTYVGTLLDCTKHDWAPPRFCDSPTSDLESRTPKGRGKRGRANTSSAAVSSAASATNAPVPATSASSNSELTIAETRSGKLRQTSVKGRGRGGAVIPASPVKDVPGMKRKVRDGDLATPAIDPKAAKKPRTLSRGTPTNNGAASPIPDLQPQQDNGSNADIEVIRPLISPQLIECPEPNCNKKYRHINGLKYHQTHAHGNPQGSGENTVPMDNGDSKSMTESLEEEENRQPSPKPLVSTPVDASQDIVKPAVLRPSAVTSNESKESSVKVLNQAVNIYSGSTPPKESLEAIAKPEEGLDSVQVLSSSSVNNLHPNKPNSTDSSNQAHPNSVQQTGGRENVSRNGNTASHLPSDPSLVPMQQKTSRVDSSLQPQVSHKVIQKTHHVPSQIPPNMSHSLHQTPPQHKHPVNQNLAAPLTVAHQSNHLPAHLQQSSVQLLQKPSIPVNQNQKASSPLAQMIHPAQVRPQSPQVLQGSSKPISTPHPQPPLSLSHSSLPGQSHPSPIIQQSPMRTDAKQDLLNRLNSANRPPGGGSEPTVITSSALSAGISSVPQGTPLSSLPGSMGTSHKLKPGAESDAMAGAPKEIVNGLPPKPETDLASREDTRSPAYSDISDANDSAPVIDGDVDGKDFKDEKKGELGVGGAPPYAYSLYYGSYGQPPHPYLMPPLSHSQQGLPPKPVDREIKDKIVDKDKAVPLPGGSEYMKIPPHYVYSYPHLYPPGYPEMYLRDSVGKDFEKGKMNPEELGPEENGGKGPTDLSKSSHCLDREGKIDSIPSKDPESHGFLPSDRRPMDSYRYVSSYNPRVPLVGAPSEKPMEIKIPGQKPPTPVPLLSPRHNSTPPGPNSSLREDKPEKRPDAKPEGVKPTMETTGPPPPPNSSAYYPHFPYGSMSFDPYRPPMIPGISAGMPAYLGGPPPGLPGLRYPLGVSNCPEDLSSGGSGPPLPPGLYAGSHKMAELHERAQKSPSAPPGSVSSPMSMGMNPPHGLPPSVSSPTSGISQASMISASHLGERKTPPVGMRFPPHPSLPDGYPPYPFLPTHFPPHFAALGMNPTALPTVGVGGPGVPPSGMGGVAHPPK